MLRYAEFGPNRGMREPLHRWLADEIEQRSQGRLVLRTSFGGSLISAKNVLRGVSAGVADLGTIVAAYTPAQFERYRVADLPVGEDDPWVGLRAAIEEQHRARKAALLWAIRTGAYQLGLLAVPEWITRLAVVLGALLALIRSIAAAHLSLFGRGAHMTAAMGLVGIGLWTTPRSSSSVGMRAPSSAPWRFRPIQAPLRGI